jgi:hypothetical protein
MAECIGCRAAAEASVRHTESTERAGEMRVHLGPPPGWWLLRSERAFGRADNELDREFLICGDCHRRGAVYGLRSTTATFEGPVTP